MHTRVLYGHSWYSNLQFFTQFGRFSARNNCFHKIRRRAPVQGRYGTAVKTRGKTVVSYIRVLARATIDRENRSVFSNPGLDSHINSPSVHNSFTVTPGPAVDSECKTSANRSNQQAAMFAQLDSTIVAHCCGAILPVVFFSPHFIPLSFSSLYTACVQNVAKVILDFQTNLLNLSL